MLGRRCAKLSEIDVLVVDATAINHFSGSIEDCHFWCHLHAGQGDQFVFSLSQYFPRIFILPGVRWIASTLSSGSEYTGQKCTFLGANLACRPRTLGA